MDSNIVNDVTGQAADKKTNTKISILIILVLFGLLASIYLSLMYYNVIKTGVLCEAGESISCAKVEDSKYATIPFIEKYERSEKFGIPVSVLGSVGYLFLLIYLFTLLFFKPDERQKYFGIMLPISILFMITALFYLYLMVFTLNTLCPYCTVSHLVDVIIFVLVVLWFRNITGLSIAEGFNPKKWFVDKKQTIMTFVVGFDVVLLGLIIIMFAGNISSDGNRTLMKSYLKKQTELELVSKELSEAVDKYGDGSEEVKEIKTRLNTIKDEYNKLYFKYQNVVKEQYLKIIEDRGWQWVKKVNIDIEDVPVKKAIQQPSIDIIMFSDFMCGHCRDAKYQIEKQMKKRGLMINLYYKHYPIDKECNKYVKRSLYDGSCILAKAMYSAYRNGKFWEAYEKLYGKSFFYNRPELDEVIKIMESCGITEEDFLKHYNSTEAQKYIEKHIDEAEKKLDIKGTPMIIVNGRILKGMPDDKTFDAIMWWEEYNARQKTNR